MPTTPHELFVSYSWDSEAHIRRVLSFVQTLRAGGIDAWLDKFETPDEPWPLWCYRQLDGARHVLVVCTEQYRRRVMREEEAGAGRGATWEGAILTNEIYNSTGGQSKVIPVVFSKDDVRHVPYFLEGFSVYDLSDSTESTDLYARLTGQRRIAPEPLGARMRVEQAVLETAHPLGAATARAVTPSEPFRAITLADAIEGTWIVDVQNPMLGLQTMRVKLTRSVLGKRRFDAQAVVGTPGWRGSGEWELLPGDRIALRGTQAADLPYPQMGPIQESYVFSTVSESVLEGVNAAGMSVTWRRD
jgi:hypothetical protein